VFHVRDILYAHYGLRKGHSLREELDVSLLAIGKRVKEIRGVRFQEPFLQELFARTGHRISQASLSRIERGKEAASLEDLVALAAVDPKGRGREWLVFGVYEARRSRRTSAPMDDEVSPEAPDRPLRVAEQGRTYPATAEPSGFPTPPTRRQPKRRP
jgi:transcriptional regulator with XRE-family HTH domain